MPAPLDPKDLWIIEDDTLREQLIIALQSDPDLSVLWPGQEDKTKDNEVQIRPTRAAIFDGECIGGGNQHLYRNRFRYNVEVSVPYTRIQSGDIKQQADSIAGLITGHFWRKKFNRIKIEKIGRNEIGDSIVDKQKGVYYKIVVSLTCEHTYHTI